MHHVDEELDKAFFLAELDTEGRVMFHTIPDVSERQQLLYFVAPWCSICHLSLPNLELIHREDPTINIAVIVLSYENAQEIWAMKEKLGLTLPLYLGTKELSDYYQVSLFPSYYLLSPSKKVLARGQGYSTRLGFSWLLKK